MDRIEKALKKLHPWEREIIQEILSKIKRGDIQGLNIKKLKGRGDIFRARKGDIRIIYRVKAEGNMFLLAIERKSEKTYRGL